MQPVSSPRKRPATDNEVAGKADTSQKKHKKTLPPDRSGEGGGTSHPPKPAQEKEQKQEQREVHRGLACRLGQRLGPPVQQPEEDKSRSCLNISLKDIPFLRHCT